VGTNKQESMNIRVLIRGTTGTYSCMYVEPMCTVGFWHENVFFLFAGTNRHLQYIPSR
jgi:hypothetical protein